MFMRASSQRILKFIRALYLENRILNQNLKYQSLQKRDIQDIRGVYREIHKQSKERASSKDEGREPSSVTLGTKGERLSKEERRVDALALRAEERRDKLRKAAGSCT